MRVARGAAPAAGPGAESEETSSRTVSLPGSCRTDSANSRTRSLKLAAGLATAAARRSTTRSTSASTATSAPASHPSSRQTSAGTRRLPSGSTRTSMAPSSIGLEIRNLPVDRGLARSLERLVHPGKRPRAEEATARGERGGVRRLQHDVALRVDPRQLLLRVATPQEKDHRVRPGVDRVQSGVGELLPALP